MPTTPRATAVFEVRGLTKTYHVGDVDVVALRDVSLRLPKGEFEHRAAATLSNARDLLQPGDTVVLHPPDTLIDGARITAREREAVNQ